jgi:hypothetical protein
VAGGRLSAPCQAASWTTGRRATIMDPFASIRGMASARPAAAPQRARWAGRSPRRACRQIRARGAALSYDPQSTRSIPVALRWPLQSFPLFERRCELGLTGGNPFGYEALTGGAGRGGRLLDQFANVLANRRDASVKVCETGGGHERGSFWRAGLVFDRSDCRYQAYTDRHR